MVGSVFHSKLSPDVKDENLLCQETRPLKLEESLGSRKRKETQRILAISLCAISAIVNVVLFILGLVFAILRNSPATYAFSVDCALDCLSSVIVLWRYFGSPYTLFSSTRENRACTCLGGLFVLAGIGVIIEGGFFLAWKEKPKWITMLVVLAAIGATACLLLGIFKYVLHKKLNSKSLFLDAINSFLSGIFALVIIISDLVYNYDSRVWYLDPLLSIIFSFVLVVYGSHVIWVHVKGDARS